MTGSADRAGSEPSDSSEDFYAEEQDRATIPHGSTPGQNGFNGDDDHMSLESQSVRMSPEPYARLEDSIKIIPEGGAGKRKLEMEPASQPPKRPRVTLEPADIYSRTVPRTRGVPAEVWQHVFTFLPPDALSRCLSVNRAFNMYLTCLEANISAPLSISRNQLQIVKSDSIWEVSRKTFSPNLPRPLEGLSELDMFKLLGGSFCQLCGVAPHPSGHWDTGTGPGPDGDVDVLLSAAKSLKPGLAHAFQTPSMHYIPSTLQATGLVPKGTQMSKVYYRKQVEEIQHQYHNALALGPAAAEEWLKGLVDLGKSKIADSARWERWAAQFAPGTDLSSVLREYFRLSSPSRVNAAQPSTSGALLPQSLPIAHPLPQRVNTVTSDVSTTPVGYGTPQQSMPPFRAPRNAQEVAEAKALRRAEIERLCREEFEPPLYYNVLRHMESFQAAVQIGHPLTESAWSLLKSRLLAQRDAAEQVEYLRAEQERALQAAIPDPSYMDVPSKASQEAADRAYEISQGPVRNVLGSLADEVIRQNWRGGAAVTKNNAPSFAADILLTTRKRYLEIASTSPALVNISPEGRGSQSPHERAFLSLDNMKWVYDNKIKNIAEKLRKDLFVCSACEGILRYYAFEGMMQHYGAKHTTDFSKGNIVVHWQTAEWPEECPFEEDPVLAEARFNGGGTSTTPQMGVPGSSAYPFASPLSFVNTPYAHNGPFAPPAVSGLPTSGEGYHSAQQAFSPPAQTTALSIAQMFSGYQAPPPPAPSTSVLTQPYAFPPPATMPASPAYGSLMPPPNLYQDQLNELATVAREVWDSTSGVKDLQECVRIQVVLHHVVSRFKERFSNEPTLDLLTDALVNHPLMRPIKNASNLACRTCISSNLDGSGAYQSYSSRIADSKMYNVSSLITHFKTVHLGGSVTSTPSFDWKSDMIELPEDQLIKDLQHASGMDDDKLATIAQAFPRVFAGDLPRIGLVKEPLQMSDKYMSPEAIREWQKQQKLKRKTKKKDNKTGYSESTTRAPQNDYQDPSYDEPDTERSGDAPPRAAEDEYDPRHPMIESLDSKYQRRRSGGKRHSGNPRDRNGRRTHNGRHNAVSDNDYDNGSYRPGDNVPSPANVSVPQYSPSAAANLLAGLDPTTLAALATITSQQAAGNALARARSRTASLGREGPELDSDTLVGSGRSNHKRPRTEGRRKRNHQPAPPLIQDRVTPEEERVIRGPDAPAGEPYAGEYYEEQYPSSQHLRQEWRPVEEPRAYYGGPPRAEQLVIRAHPGQYQEYHPRQPQPIERPLSSGYDRLPPAYAHDEHGHVRRLGPRYADTPTQYISRQEQDHLRERYRYEEPPRYVDQFGRPVEVVIVDDVPPPRASARYAAPPYEPAYRAPQPQVAEYTQPPPQAYDGRHYVYYEDRTPPEHMSRGVMRAAPAGVPMREEPRYIYDDEDHARASVGR